MIAIKVPRNHNESIYKIEVQSVTKTQRNPEYKKIDLSDWNIDDFPQELHEELEEHRISSMKCLTVDDIEYNGYKEGYNSKYLVIDFARCYEDGCPR